MKRSLVILPNPTSKWQDTSQSENTGPGFQTALPAFCTTQSCQAWSLTLSKRRLVSFVGEGGWREGWGVVSQIISQFLYILIKEAKISYQLPDGYYYFFFFGNNLLITTIRKRVNPAEAPSKHLTSLSWGGSWCSSCLIRSFSPGLLTYGTFSSGRQL